MTGCFSDDDDTPPPPASRFVAGPVDWETERAAWGFQDRDKVTCRWETIGVDTFFERDLWETITPGNGINTAETDRENLLGLHGFDKLIGLLVAAAETKQVWPAMPVMSLVAAAVDNIEECGLWAELCAARSCGHGDIPRVRQRLTARNTTRTESVVDTLRAALQMTHAGVPQSVDVVSVSRIRDAATYDTVVYWQTDNWRTKTWVNEWGTQFPDTPPMDLLTAAKIVNVAVLIMRREIGWGPWRTDLWDAVHAVVHDPNPTAAAVLVLQWLGCPSRTRAEKYLTGRTRTAGVAWEPVASYVRAGFYPVPVEPGGLLEVAHWWPSSPGHIARVFNPANTSLDGVVHREECVWVPAVQSTHPWKIVADACQEPETLPSAESLLTAAQSAATS